MSKTTILYKDIAPGADEDSNIITSPALAGSDVSKLPFGVSSVPAITGELNQWGLDGTFVLPVEIAFWSEELSGDNCSFENPPVITIDFGQQYTSMGVSLYFDTASLNYCTEVNIKWYQGDTLKADVDFNPTGTFYFCNQLVQSYDKIVITLNKTNLPRRRARLEHIIFGVYRPFEMDEIRSASIVNEMSLSGLELPVSSISWVLDSREDIEYIFQKKQPIEVRNNDNLIGVYYIDTSNRSGKSLYSINSDDAIGVLDENTFTGGVYTNKSAKELVSEILGGDFDIEYDSTVEDTQLTGAITAFSKREALQQVFFAWGVLVSTDGGESIRVFTMPDVEQEIGTDRTYTGVSVDTSAIVTEVRVTAHTYTQDSNGSLDIAGKKYTDTTSIYTVKNPNVVGNDKQNVKEVTGATLVSPSIGQAVAQRVYDYYLRRNTHNGKIVWKGERLGDLLTIPNSWGGKNTGNLQKMTITLSNTVAASCETLGV